MKARLRTPALVVASFLCVSMSCRQHLPSDPLLEPVTWLVASIEGRAVAPGAWITARFDHHTEAEISAINGTDACGGYRATVDRPNDVLRLDGKTIGGLEMGVARGSETSPCPSDVVHYRDALRGLRFPDISGDRLTMVDSTHGPVITYVAQPQTLLEGHVWQVSSYRDGSTTDHQSLISPSPGDPPTIEFLPDGTLRVFTGCDTFDTRYRFETEQLILEDGSPDQATVWSEPTHPSRCSEAIAHQQASLLDDVGAAWWWRIGSGEFQLMTGSSTVLVVLGAPAGAAG